MPLVGYTAQNMPSNYMTADQRFAAQRPDVLVYQTPALTEDLTIAGPIDVALQVSTTGTDADFVVKLIDVYPGDHPSPEQPSDAPGYPVKMGGYQQLVRGEPFRGKFRNSFEKPEPFVPGQPATIAFAMPDAYHTFRRGHRVMVQVQSSWFPFIDRNPQTFVDITKATDADFKKQTHRVYRSRQPRVQPDGARRAVTHRLLAAVALTLSIAPPARGDAPPRRDLSVDEQRGGHSLARHVGRTDAQLRQRLRDQPNISAASTYPDRETAEHVVTLVLEASADRIRSWTRRQGSRPNLALRLDDPRGPPIGRVLERGARAPCREEGVEGVSCRHRRRDSQVGRREADPRSWWRLGAAQACRPGRARCADRRSDEAPPHACAGLAAP